MARWRRVFVFAFALCLLGVGLYFQYGQPPLVAVASGSMEPALHRGDLIVVGPVDVASIQEGDIIVVDVPPSVQETYGYQPSIVHRVVEIRESPTGDRAFRIKGDNAAAEDPFTVLPQDVAGQVVRSYPNAGYPILYLQSPQGQLFVVAAVIIYMLYTFSDALMRRGGAVRNALSRSLNAATLEKMDAVEAKHDAQARHTEQALGDFSSAMQEYAQHLASHTAAVQAMAAAAEELRASSALQNEALYAMLGRRAPRPAPRQQRSLDAWTPRDATPLEVLYVFGGTDPEILADLLTSDDSPVESL